METKILLTKKKYEKNPKTKTTYKLISTETEIITLEQHEMGTSMGCANFFKRLGASFTRLMGYTSEGYKCVRTINTSPDKKKKSVSEYKFL